MKTVVKECNRHVRKHKWPFILFKLRILDYVERWKKLLCVFIGVNPGGLGVTTHRFWAGDRGGRREVVDRSRKITIAYFAKKLCWKVVCSKKDNKIGPECNFCVENRKFDFRNRRILRWKRKFLATGFTTPRFLNRIHDPQIFKPGPRPPRFQTRLTPLCVLLLWSNALTEANIEQFQHQSLSFSRVWRMTSKSSRR